MQVKERQGGPCGLKHAFRFERKSELEEAISKRLGNACHERLWIWSLGPKQTNKQQQKNLCLQLVGQSVNLIIQY